MVEPVRNTESRTQSPLDSTTRVARVKSYCYSELIAISRSDFRKYSIGDRGTYLDHYSAGMVKNEDRYNKTLLNVGYTGAVDRTDENDDGDERPTTPDDQIAYDGRRVAVGATSDK
nr:hypothetical protein CFP56_71009 [Quercus suber]